MDATADRLPLPTAADCPAAPAGVNIAPGSADDGWVMPPPVALGDGTEVQLYKDGEALHAAYRAMERAQRRICLEVYIFRSDPTGRAFADLLCAKARQGLDIYLIYDSFGSLGSDPVMFQQMHRAGVRLGEFHPIRPWQCRFSWRPANRDHRKLLIIDDQVAGLGGLNVGAEYAGSWIVRDRRNCDPWRDNAISVRGPAVRALLAAFGRTWRYIQIGGRLRRTELLHQPEAGDWGVLASAPTRSSPAVPLLRSLLREARHTIQLTMSYFAPPDELIDALCRAARRGVRVQLMLPNRSDVRLLLTAARSFYATLLSAGVEIYERLGAILHAKTLCIDRKVCVIGSMNLDYRSIEYNLELSMVIRSETLGEQMHALFANDMSFAKPISPGEWRRRPTYDRVVHWAVQRARYLL